MKDKIISIYQAIPTRLKNRYFISVFCFIIWIFFFDTNSIITQINQSKEIKKIKQDQFYFRQEIEKDQSIIDIISQDSLTPEFEKYLRENLFLSKKNEEIFIIE